MKRVYLGWEVVWSLPLVVMVIGGQLAVLGCAGMLAATPPAAGTPLFFSNRNASEIVSFSPVPFVGERSLQLEVGTGSLAPPGSPGMLIPHLPPVLISIVVCSYPNCQQPGGFQVTVPFFVGGWAQTAIPNRATTFLLTVSSLDLPPGANWTLPVSVVVTWLGGSGFPQAFSESSVLFAGGMLGGLILLVAAWAIGKHAGYRYVREYALANQG